MTAAVPRRDVAPLDADGFFSRSWYSLLVNTANTTSGLVNVQLYSDTGAVNAMAISSGATSLAKGTVRYVSPAYTNTSTAVTLNDTKLGAKPVLLADGSLPSVGQIVAGTTTMFQYDGANWRVLSLQNTSQSFTGDVTIGGKLTSTGAFTANSTSTLKGLAALQTVDSTVVDDASNALAIGFKGWPQVVKNANATTVMSDRSKHWYHSDGSAYTWTIDSNANVAFPIGTQIDFVCKATAAANITLAITSDALVWLPSGGTGSRTLGQYARARALKVAATTWVLDGVGIT